MQVSDEDIPLRAFAHPLRLRLLSLLTGTAMSAAEAAREIGTTQANASYHLRQLHAAGLLEIAEEVSVRGGRARRYRHEPSTGDRLRSGGTGDQVMLAAALSEELRRRSGHRVSDERGMLTDAELWVDEAVWIDVRDRVRSAMLDLHAAARPPRTSGTLRTSSTVSLFVMRPDDQQP